MFLRRRQLTPHSADPLENWHEDFIKTKLYHNLMIQKKHDLSGSDVMTC